jgi:DNA-binding NarL/FixJ family response regulator
MAALLPGLRSRAAELAVAVIAGAVAGLLGVGIPSAIGVALAVALFAELASRHAPSAPEQELVSEPPRPRGDLRPLSRREAEVARLVADGLSNREIAARLSRGERGIETHIQHCFNKLTFHNRAELTRWVVEHDLVAASDSVVEKSVPRN